MKSRYDTTAQIKKSSGARQLRERWGFKDYTHAFGEVGIKGLNKIRKYLSREEGVDFKKLSGREIAFGLTAFSAIVIGEVWHSQGLNEEQVNEIRENSAINTANRINHYHQNLINETLLPGLTERFEKSIEKAVAETREETLKDIDRIFGLKELGLSYKDLKEMEEQGLELKDYKIGPREEVSPSKPKLRYPDDYS
ncbi:hypothetical protein COU53_00705 [Candidatus Pacearchaeota archaeon CG10_big_fil_rev_8_21_14_0_10_30_48]|nr:MAG: hypothetical protein COU53_00705 [Candidatus Pacearchaeota archaeon CG10_big_fil_rev_8_21_14_0_10_30_48]